MAPLFVLISLVVVSFTGCYYGDANISVEGVVIDTSEKPIEGARVRFIDDQGSVISEYNTRTNGRVRLSRSFAPTQEYHFKLLIEKEGFEPYEKDLKTGAYMHQKFRLKPTQAR